MKKLRKFYFLLPTSYLVLTVKKLEKCLSAGRSARSCNTKWKPVVSMPVNALDEPPCFCRKALNAPSSGKLSVPRNLPGGGVQRWRYGGSSRTRTQGGTAFGQLALPEAACSVGPCLRLPSGCPQASANQPPGLRWPAVPGLTFDTAMEHHVLSEVGEPWTLVRVREVAGVHLQCGRRLLRVRIVHEQHAQPVARTQPPVLLLVSRW